MPKLNAKQQKQLQRQSSIQAAKALEKMGLCQSVKTETGYAVTVLVEPSSEDTQNKESEIKAKMLKERERLVDSIMCYSAQLRLAAEALKSENDQLVLLNYMTMVEPGARIKAFRQALRDKILSYPAGLPDHLKK